MQYNGIVFQALDTAVLEYIIAYVVPVIYHVYSLVLVVFIYVNFL